MESSETPEGLDAVTAPMNPVKDVVEDESKIAEQKKAKRKR